MNALRKGKGSILITTLWIMAILSLLAMGIGFRASLEVRLSKYTVDKLKARYLAKAGIMKALERLAEDKTPYDTLYECGIKLNDEETPESVFAAEFNKLDGGSFSVHLMDEERKININLSKYEGDKNGYRNIMARLLPEPAEGEFAKEDLINAMFDWQGQLVGIPSTEHGKTEYSYAGKNGDFEFTEELLLVKGMTRDLFEQIEDHITVYGDGKININTASREVLEIVIGLPEFIDEQIMRHRQGLDGIEGTEDDRAFRNAGIPGMPENKKNYFGAESKNYRITSHGNRGNVKSVINCVVKKEARKEGKEFEYYHEE